MPTSKEELEKVIVKSAPHPWRRRIIILVLAHIVGIGGFRYWQSRGSAEDAGPDYMTKPAAMGHISLVVTASGSLEPTNKVVIGSELSGTVQEVYVDTNDPVKIGDPLAKLDTLKLDQQADRSRASLAAAKARVSQVKATLMETRAAYKRHQELHRISGGKTPSEATLETSKAAVARAEADLESAEASVSGAQAEVGAIERDLDKATITSPVNGVVLARSIEVGQTVAASFTAPTLFTIAEDLATMRLDVAVVEADIGRVEPGQTASFNVDAWPGRSYTATVKKVALGANDSATTGVVTYRTELEVDNRDLSLRPGMTATVDISIIDKKDILVVPNAALRFDPDLAAQIGKPAETGDRTLIQNLNPSGGRRWAAMRRQFKPDADKDNGDGPAVWVLHEGKPTRRDINTGITDGIITEITGGSLDQGVEVIIGVRPSVKGRSKGKA